MRLDGLIIGLLVFSLFIVVGFTCWFDVNTEYKLNNSEGDYKKAYNVTYELYGISRGMEDETLKADTEGSDQSWESLIKGTYSSVRLIGRSFDLMGDIGDAIQDRLDIPRIFIDVAMAAILISII